MIRYWLSKFIPMRFTSTYGVFGDPNWAGSPPVGSTPDLMQTSTWWQWRHGVYKHRIVGT